MWREEQTLWDVMSPLFRDKNEKAKSFRSRHRRCSVKKVFLEVAGLAKFLRAPFLTEHIRATASKI